MSGYFARLAAQIDARVETVPRAQAIKPLEQQVEVPAPNADTTAAPAAMAPVSAVLFPPVAHDAHGFVRQQQSLLHQALLCTAEARGCLAEPR